MLADKDSVAAASAELRARVGLPAATFEELHAAESFDERKWYIDDFSDLRTAT
jgi:phytoene/squalene synthetase